MSNTRVLPGGDEQKERQFQRGPDIEHPGPEVLVFHGHGNSSPAGVARPIASCGRSGAPRSRVRGCVAELAAGKGGCLHYGNGSGRLSVDGGGNRVGWWIKRSSCRST